MLHLYSTSNHSDQLQEVNSFTKAKWINLIEPTEKEIDLVIKYYNVERSFLRAALDKDEGARSEIEDDQTLIIFDVPMSRSRDAIYTFETLPLALIVLPKVLITVTLRDNAVIKSLLRRPPKAWYQNTQSYFALQIILRSMTVYLDYLKKIDQRSRQLETQLYESMQNSELIKMLGLQKSLVYFTTSLKSTETMLNKFNRSSKLLRTEANQELYEDVIIESNQALEMANVYSNTLAGVMDAFASIISNNQNLVMKTLTVVTVVIAIPTLIFSFFGMNVDLPFGFFSGSLLSWLIPIGLALIFALLTILFLWRKKSL